MCERLTCTAVTGECLGQSKKCRCVELHVKSMLPVFLGQQLLHVTTMWLNDCVLLTSLGLGQVGHLTQLSAELPLTAPCVVYRHVFRLQKTCSVHRMHLRDLGVVTHLHVLQGFRIRVAHV